MLPNIPAGFGGIRVRATCVENGVTRAGQSDFFNVPTSGVVRVADIKFEAIQPTAERLVISTPVDTLTMAGQTVQLTVTARYADGTTVDVTTAPGIGYTISNPAVATVSPEGLLTALSSGTVILGAARDGASGFLRLQVILGGDSDGDGLPDDYEVANGLDPNDPVDALDDPDRDGLSTADEAARGLDPFDSDTDGDTLSDGQEVSTFRTDPARFDTDGDGLSDGLEVETGSDPLNPASYNLAAALSALEVSPPSFLLTTNTVILAEVSVQLTVRGRLRDGTTLDLTSTARGTSYASSDLTVCNFGSVSGRVFAGNPGACVITATLGGFTARATGGVQSFTPRPLAALDLPAFANKVQVRGDLVYVAGGPAGLHVIDVADRMHPLLLRTLPLPGNANDVQLQGDLALVAGGTAGLHVIDLSDPRVPVLAGTADTPGEAIAVAVAGDHAYVADGLAGLQVVSIADPESPSILAGIDRPGRANGIDLTGSLVAMSNFSAALDLFDVATPSSPRLLGSVALGASSFDVALSPPLAYVASSSNLRVLDIADPAQPRLTGSFGAGLFMTDLLQVPGGLIFTTQIRPDTPMPIFDLRSTPAAPGFIGSILFSQLGFGAGDGTGLAADSRYVYLTATRGFEAAYKPGSSGLTRLYIGEYSAGVVDTTGVAPSVQIVSPAPGARWIEGTSNTVAVEAADDFGVAAVDLLVDGALALTEVSSPYRFTFLAPAAPRRITLGAAATDFAGNRGVAEDVTVDIIPDAPPSVRLVAPAEGSALTARTTTVLIAEASDDVSVAAVTFAIGGVELAPVSVPPYQSELRVPLDVSSLTIRVTAVDNTGKTSSTERVVPVLPEPRTTAAGAVVDTGGLPLAGASVTCLGVQGSSAPDGTFSIAGVSALLGDVRCTALFQVPGGALLSGNSATVPPVVGGTTSLGQIVVRPPAAALYAYPAPKFAVGQVPLGAVSVAATDLDLDGQVDVVATHPFSNTVSILMLNGDGKPRPALSFTVGTEPSGVGTGDFNGDGIPDVVTANLRSNNVSLLLGSGGGAFQPPVSFAAGNGPFALTVADFDRDGLADVAVANRFSDDVSVLRGGRDNTLVTAATLAAGDSPGGLAAADLDGNGILDLVATGESSDDVSVFRGHGDGTFVLQAVVPAGDAPRAVQVADLDGNGALDLAVASATSTTVSILPRTPDGTFLSRQQTPGLGADLLLAADMDRDGRPDLVTSGGILLTRDGGAFESKGTRVGGNPWASLAVADLNRDAIPDVVAGTGFEAVFLFGNGDGTVQTPRQFATGGTARDVVSADVDGDGLLDLVVANQAPSNVTVLPSLGDGTFAAPQLAVNNGCCSYGPIGVAAGDLNGDGFIDAMTANTSFSSVSVLQGDGSATLRFISLTSHSGTPAALTFADFNRDGRLDAAVVDENDAWVYLGNGDGTFQPRRLLAVSAFSPRISSVVAADVNNDGAMDVITANSRLTYLSLFLGNGDGTFQTEATRTTGQNPTDVALADFNGDGALDLVASNRGSNSLSLRLGNGDGTFATQTFLPVGSGQESVATGDVDGDGVTDIVATGTSSLWVLPGRGDGTFGPAQAYVGLGKSLLLLDLDGDGAPEAVTAGSGLYVFPHLPVVP